MRICRLISSLALCTPILGPLLTFATAAGIALHSNGNLTITKIFTSFSIIVLLNSPLSKIIIALPQIAGAAASFQRIQDYLNATERKDSRTSSNRDARDGQNTEVASMHTVSNAITEGGSDNTAMVNEKPLSPTATLASSIIVSISGKYSWPEDAISIQGDVTITEGVSEDEGQTDHNSDDKPPVIHISPCLEIHRRTLTLILGPVGCGKSILLKALLGELSTFDGSIKTQFSGSATFCDQTPWLPNETVREIICGKSAQETSLAGEKQMAEDMDWYRCVVNACALERDMEIWPRGDQTPVGSKGISMSGGQKQRLVSFYFAPLFPFDSSDVDNDNAPSLVNGTSCVCPQRIISYG